MQERRTYIPQGWSKFYEFSLPDLRAGATLLEKILERSPVQWLALRGLLENAVYGGRVDNIFDLKVLNTYLDQYFSQQTFTSGQLSSDLKIPNSKNYNDYVTVIDRLSDTDLPSMFGLPLNIDRSVQRFNSTNVIKQLKQLSAVSQEELEFDREEWSVKLGPLWNLWQTLQRSGEKFKGNLNESEDPLESFVYLEAKYAFKMLEKVHFALEGINKVISGQGLLTSDIESDAKALLQNIVPDSWSGMWEGPSSPVPWLRALVRRTNALKKWVEGIRTGNLFSDSIALGELFHPETFLNALRQLTSRKLSTPMEQLKLLTTFDSNIQNGIQLKGLLLQGCEFSRGALISPNPASPELTPLPVCGVAWVKKDVKESNEDRLVKIPLYYSLEREKLLCTLSLPNSGRAEERIISGAALFLTGSE